MISFPLIQMLIAKHMIAEIYQIILNGISNLNNGKLDIFDTLKRVIPLFDTSIIKNASYFS